MKRLTPEQIDALRSVPLGGAPNKLAIARAMVRVDQGTVADAAGLTQPTISDIETGTKSTRLATAQAIAAAFGAGVDDIFPSREMVAS